METPSNNFMENYRKFCADHRTHLKVKLINEKQCLVINTDMLDEEDWIPLNKALKLEKNIHSLIIKSDYEDKHTLKNQIKPSIFKLKVIKELSETLSTCLKESKILSTLKLKSLPFNKNHFETLIDGIEQCISLQHLSITHCALNEDNVNSLCRVIRSHTGIQTLDLTKCKITDKGAQHIADLIHAHKLVRYSETWKQSLRYRTINPDVIPGIRRITLNDNPGIKDAGYSFISHELLDDLWVKAVDMQNCGLTVESGISTIHLLKTNKTLMVLDVRHNRGIPNETITNIKTILTNRKNKIEKSCVGNNNNNEMYKWLDDRSTSNLSSYNTISKKPNSEFSSNFSKTKNENNSIISKVNSLATELYLTKRSLKDTEKCLLDEKAKMEKLEKDKQKQKATLKDKIIKECNRIKLIEKERDRLKNELNNYVHPKSTKSTHHFQNLNKIATQTKSSTALKPKPSIKSSKTTPSSTSSSSNPKKSLTYPKTSIKKVNDNTPNSKKTTLERIYLNTNCYNNNSNNNTKFKTIKSNHKNNEATGNKEAAKQNRKQDADKNLKKDVAPQNMQQNESKTKTKHLHLQEVKTRTTQIKGNLKTKHINHDNTNANDELIKQGVKKRDFKNFTLRTSNDWLLEDMKQSPSLLNTKAADIKIPKNQNKKLNSTNKIIKNDEKQHVVHENKHKIKTKHLDLQPKQLENYDKNQNNTKYDDDEYDESIMTDGIYLDLRGLSSTARSSCLSEEMGQPQQSLQALQTRNTKPKKFNDINNSILKEFSFRDFTPRSREQRLLKELMANKSTISIDTDTSFYSVGIKNEL